MKRNAKIWIIVAVTLVILGTVMFSAALVALDFDFGGLETVKYETNTYKINEYFDNISVNTKTASVVLELSDNEVCEVVCYERSNVKHAVSVEEGTLNVSVSDDRKWWEHITLFSFKTPKITVYLPRNEYSGLSVRNNTGNVNVSKDFSFETLDISVDTSNVNVAARVSGEARMECDTGNINIENTSFGSADISCDTGNISIKSVKVNGKLCIETDTGRTKLSDTTCKTLEAESDTGNIVLENVIADESLSLKTDTGDIIFKKSDAPEIYAKTSTGDVKGSLLSDKVFSTHTSTGKIKVPETSQGGKCEIKTSTGNINIVIE